MRIGLFVASMFVVGCQSSSTKQPTPEAPAEVQAAPTPQPALPNCCADRDELVALNGQRVEVRGIYQKVNVSKRPPPIDLTVAGNVSIQSGSVGVMLGIYYESSSVRSVAEIQRLHDKEVIVTGTVHDRTPDQLHNGIPMQTMTAPYIEVESVRVVDAQSP